MYSLLNKAKGIKSHLVLLIVNKSMLEYSYLLKKMSCFEKIIIFDSVIFKTDITINDLLNKYVNYPLFYYDTSDSINMLNTLAEKSDINIFSSKQSFSLYILKKYKDRKINLHEDGENIYYLQPMNLRNFIFYKLIYRYPFRAETTDLIENIYTQNPSRLPRSIQNKGIMINYNSIHRNLSAENKEFLKEIFFRDFTIKHTSNKKCLLLTQPLSEDRLVSEEYKIELYKKIINEYAEGFELYIKPHPREITNYRFYLNRDFEEIPNNFPIEILNSSGFLTIERGITLFSSALNNSDFIIEKIFLGHDWDNKLFSNAQKKFI